MTILFANNASSTVAGSITSTSTTVALAAGTGVLFPNPSGGDYFCVTFYDQATKTIDEICHCTARSGDTLTIVRAQEGTSARAWSAGDIIANLVTAGTLAAFVQAGPPAASTSIVYVGIDTSTTPNLIIANTTPVPASYQTGMLFNIKIANTNTGPCTLQFNGVAGVRASRTNGSDLVGGNLTAAEEMMFVYNGVDFTSMVPPIPQVPPQYIFYVRPDGNDNNSGFANTPQQAFRTVSGAIYQIKARYISAQTVTIRVADGNYTDCFGDYQSYIASWSIVGNTTNPGNVVINATSVNPSAYPAHVYGYARGCICEDTANISIDGFTFQSYFENVAASAGVLSVTSCYFTAPTSGLGSSVRADGGGALSLFGTCQYSGANPAQTIFQVDTGASMTFGYDDTISPSTLTFNITGTPTVTLATAVATENGSLTVFNTVVTFTGFVPNCAQFLANAGGGVAFTTGVTTTIPGTQPPIITPPGWTAHG